ncbi:RNA polymerase sigma factor [Methylotenera sp.]|uniref:RNA polymerase sigma factor n=1 Tax=Methylotenera sp. TaxID=2051956 RepID=UPI00248811E9|nr:RNA polymerase sigma factor [Methylotenera sp.]MDI1361156.1 RNA polymerase sigma factor [Methylotenera sp.]
MNELDPDAELLPRIARGDQSAIREMVAKKLSRLLALGMRMLNDRGEAEDVAQETFLRVWKQAENWQSGGAKFDTWLHKVALNLCYDRLRSRKDYTDKDYSDEDAPELIDPALIPEQRLDKSQQGDVISAALAILPNRQREALVLQYYQELSNIEAADLMGVSVDALESLLSRARRNMRALLAEQGVHKA